MLRAEEPRRQLALAVDFRRARLEPAQVRRLNDRRQQLLDARVAEPMRDVGKDAHVSASGTGDEACRGRRKAPHHLP